MGNDGELRAGRGDGFRLDRSYGFVAVIPTLLLRGENEEEGRDGDHGYGGGDEDGTGGTGHVDVVLAGDDKGVGGDG
jgi:hypothetical protein